MSKIKKLTAASAAILAAIIATPVTAANADTLLPGIDVSRWQGTINWGSVVNSGIRVPIIKATGGDGGLYVDSRQAYNATQANAHYSNKAYYHFNGYQNGATQAEYMSAHLVAFRDGDTLIYDAEGKFTNPTNAYLWAVRMHQLRPTAKLGVYMSQSVTRSYNWQAVESLGYVTLWVAQYFYDGSTNHNPSVGYWPTWGAWQYTSSGRVPGISGNVDRNVVKQGAWSGTSYSGGGASTSSSGNNIWGYSVSTIQRLLNAKGYSLAVDGIYGNATRAATRDYQSKHGLAVDGIVGPVTWASLNGTTSTTVYSSGVYVTRAPAYWKMSVANVQRMLNGWGYNLSVDGVRGGRTDNAVKAFQRARGLSPDGVVESRTVSALYPSTATVQRRLNAFGYRLAVDGIKGYRTRAAIIDFQRRHGLYRDGIVGPATWYRLGY